MHTNAILLQRLFTSLDQHDHRSMADCYHTEARFTDIAFDLRGENKIHAMWHMICQGIFELHSNSLMPTTTMGELASLMITLSLQLGIESTMSLIRTLVFEMEESSSIVTLAIRVCGLPWPWVAQADSSLAGFTSCGAKAQKMLDAFIAEHPE